MKKVLRLFMVFAVCMAAFAFSSGVSAKAATYDANKIVEYAKKKAGQGGAADLCLQWVMDAYREVYGFVDRAGGAYCYGKKVHVSSSMNDIPLGAIVYFSYGRNRTDIVYCADNDGVPAGHIGIYIGGGRMIHTFDWADGQGTRVWNNAITDIANGRLYDYAGWGWFAGVPLTTKTNIKVTLDPNGGSVGNSTYTLDCGKKYGNLSVPTRTGFLFDGWYTAKAGGSKITADTTVGTDDIKLYAHWKVDTASGYKAKYSEWSEVKTTKTKPAESDTLQIVSTSQSTTYKYFHYHNHYSGDWSMIDSRADEGNWDYCEMYLDNPISQTVNFQDRGGRTFVKKGNGCKLGYTLWFEDAIKNTVYSYKERSVIGAEKAGSNDIDYPSFDIIEFPDYSDPDYESKITDISKKEIVLSETKCIYTGKEIKPTVTISGLTQGIDFLVSYENNKKIGPAYVNVMGFGKYTGSTKVRFNIFPEKAKVKKISSKYKQITIKYDSIPGNVTGYQIQLCTDDKFDSSNVKNYTTPKVFLGTVTINKLTSGKTYYVRTRAYKKVDGTNFCSAWSTAKKIKVG